MTKHKCIRFVLSAWFVVLPVLAASGQAPLKNQPICTGSIFSPVALGSASGAGSCSLTLTATFNCLAGTSPVPCQFCLSYQLQVLKSGKWVSYWVPQGESWSEPCKSSTYYPWSGGASGMPTGRYKFVAIFWVGGCGSGTAVLPQANPEFDI